MSDHIPEELMVQIFERLPAKSIVQCKQVCKSWRSIISGPDFIRHYTMLPSHHTPELLLLARHNKTRSGKSTITKNFIHRLPLSPVPHNAVTFQKKLDQQSIKIHSPFYGRDFSSYCSRPYLEIIDVCEGVVCLSDSRRMRFILWNPSVGCTISLPPPPPPKKGNLMFSRIAQGFGFDAVNEDYKFVRIRCRNSDNNLLHQVDVYSVKTSAWMRIDCPPPAAEKPIRILHSPASFVNGALHWLADDHDKHRFIMSFHLTSEVFGKVELSEMFRSSEYLQLGVVDESLAVIQSDKYYCRIWVLEAYKDCTSWRLFSELEFMRQDKALSPPVEHVLRVRTDDHGASSDLLLLNNRSGQLMVYDQVNGGCMWKTEGKVYVGIYRESLALLNKGGGLGGLEIRRRKRANPSQQRSSKKTRTSKT